VAETRTTNARSRRTRQHLRDAVLALAEQTDFPDISVQDIVAEAGLNRSTFYLHYPDKESLIEETLAMLLEELTESGRMLRAAEDPKAVRFHSGWQDSLFRRISERPGLYRRLLGDAGPSTFGIRLLQANEDAIVDIWEKLGNAETAGGLPLRTRARFAAAGIQAVILQWLESGMIEDPDTISNWAWALSFSTSGIPSG
jgi:AcrR family transcriptional regulator